ncbi:GlxA family transcriptional regulator [Streptomyces sp. NPDC088358]|uniref:GlxA family transcriptional regulator n=1 Tax=Streptomyces sp. NPDC088358 TaxID=3365857 RepID=UPI00382CD77C
MARVRADPRTGGPSSPHTVAVLAFEGVQLLDVAGPAEVFTTANEDGADYDVHIVSETGAGIRTSSGVRLSADTSAAELPERLGTLVVPGRPDWRQAVGDRDLVDLVTALSTRSSRTASVCAGAFLLAEAGILEGRRAATHWRLAGELAARYPRVRVEADPVFVQDGPVLTSAGVTTGIDLALALVEADHGADLARAVAQQLVVFMARPAGQSQFSARMTPRGSGHPVLRGVMDAIVADPAEAHHMDALALQAGVSTRHLSRLFRTEVGMTPGRYVELVRVEAAQALLTSGNDSVDAVAERSGFGSAESMRRSFQHIIGIAPTVYRARFRSTAAQGTRA